MLKTLSLYFLCEILKLFLLYCHIGVQAYLKRGYRDILKIFGGFLAFFFVLSELPKSVQNSTMMIMSVHSGVVK